MPKKYTKPQIRKMLHRSAFDVVMNETAGAIGINNKVNIDVLVSNIIDNTVCVAFKIHLGQISADDITAQNVFLSVFALLFHLSNIDPWQTQSLEDAKETD